jgi:hypothetical protein
MNIPDHISESFETIFWVKILKFFDADEDADPGIFLTLDPGSGMGKTRIRDKHPGSAQNCKLPFKTIMNHKV